jgi:hypothetical protein
MKQEKQTKLTPKLPSHGKTKSFPAVPAQKVTVKIPSGGYTGANTGNRTQGMY